jgi:cytoplasmic iron level regulating protein YaaA (DUF328/UPF0246 family)
MSYLITCSGSKVETNQINISTLNNLSFQQLNPTRQILIEEYQIIKHTILDWNRCLPAWQLYSGTKARLYPQVSNINWTNPNTDVTILSALFGLIKHTDLIPFYDLAMTYRITIGNNLINVFDYWRNNINLNNFINPLIDIDLLSGKYRKAFNADGNPVANDPNIIWNDRYGVHKGSWLNEQL